ncbi:MAG TPA: hypothetical protein VHC67_10065 [Gaiellaceae bacterium]|nr:hypothetical protein [Gaiellaceae bacterium]
MSAGLRWTRGASSTPRYVGVGEGAAALYAAIDDLPGRRGALERLALKTIGRRPGRRADEPDIAEAWARVLETHETLGPIRTALFVYTGFYKDTVLAGVIDTGEVRFAKVFRDLEAGAAEQAKHDSLARFAAGPVALAPIVYAGNGIVAYELLPRADRTPDPHRLEAAAHAIAAAALGASRPRDSVAADELRTTVAERLAALGEGQAAEAAKKLDVAHVPLGVAHGDFTPWNTFGLPDGRLALVDYERVAERAPYTDAWHLRTQQAALGGKPGTAASAAAQVAAEAGVSRSEATMWYLTYVLEELRQDLSDWFDAGRRHRQLRRLIGVRASLLRDHARTV